MHTSYYAITYKYLFGDGREVFGEQPFICNAQDLSRAKTLFNTAFPPPGEPGARWQILDVKAFPDLNSLMEAFNLD